MSSESRPNAGARQPDDGRLPVADRLGGDHFPACTMGRATELVGVTPAFLRDPGGTGLIAPTRPDGGHRRSSRHRLKLAAWVRELVGRGPQADAACRIVGLEGRLKQVERDDGQLCRQSERAERRHRHQ
ncbi:MerR family transcriptional regulator [Streptomyces sp. NPDC005774]|uniref:MerR family transcriptional regulator n=1 Tax=Streptomyces sp. NPDC005774 TaxID=3364728 RepID=UPI003695A2FD